MVIPLWWLVLPLLASVALVPAVSRGAASARLIIPAFAVATLWKGADTFAPALLRAWASQGPAEGQFVSISIGLAIGGIGPWPPRQWSRWIAGVPLAVGLLVVFYDVLQVGPLLL